MPQQVFSLDLGASARRAVPAGDRPRRRRPRRRPGAAAGGVLGQWDVGPDELCDRLLSTLTGEHRAEDIAPVALTRTG